MRTMGLLSVVVGAVGGYFVARHGKDVDSIALAGAAWWLITAVAVSLAARSSLAGARAGEAQTAIITIFLLIWVGLPVVGVGVGLGFRDRAATAIEDLVDDFDAEFSDEYYDCLADPATTADQCESLIDSEG